MIELLQDDLIEDTERIYLAGYRAAALSDCPYVKAPVGPYVIWMQGWHQHQGDRQRVKAAAEQVWCKAPLWPYSTV